MRIVVIGCGRMGSGVSEALARGGHSVTVVDSDPKAFVRLSPAFPGRTIVGVGFDRDVLAEAGVDRADGLAALSGSDEANAVAARMARVIYRVPRVVARLYDPRKAEIYRRLGLQVISPVTWGVNRVAELLGFTTLDAVFSVGAGGVDIVVAEVPFLLDGRPAGELTAPGEVHPIAITRAGRTLLATPATTLHEGDIVHLAMLSSAGPRAAKLLGAK
jgi:trk system potassium uptake protein TrkA